MAAKMRRATEYGRTARSKIARSRLAGRTLNVTSGNSLCSAASNAFRSRFGSCNSTSPAPKTTWLANRRANAAVPSTIGASWLLVVRSSLGWTMIPTTVRSIGFVSVTWNVDVSRVATTARTLEPGRTPSALAAVGLTTTSSARSGSGIRPWKPGIFAKRLNVRPNRPSGLARNATVFVGSTVEGGGLPATPAPIRNPCRKLKSRTCGSLATRGASGLLKPSLTARSMSATAARFQRRGAAVSVRRAPRPPPAPSRRRGRSAVRSRRHPRRRGGASRARTGGPRGHDGSHQEPIDVASPGEDMTRPKRRHGVRRSSAISVTATSPGSTTRGSRSDRVSGLVVFPVAVVLRRRAGRTTDRRSNRARSKRRSTWATVACALAAGGRVRRAVRTGPAGPCRRRARGGQVRRAPRGRKSCGGAVSTDGRRKITARTSGSASLTTAARIRVAISSDSTSSSGVACSPKVRSSPASG